MPCHTFPQLIISELSPPCRLRRIARAQNLQLAHFWELCTYFIEVANIAVCSQISTNISWTSMHSLSKELPSFTDVN